MVKRQTVWLSTMMVLSLMLIGYYTVGSGSASKPSLSNTSTGGTGSGVSTSGSNDKPSVQTDSPSAPDVSKLSGSEYFAQLRIDAAAEMSKEEDQLTAQSIDPKASADQVAQAKKQLDDLTALDAKIQSVQDAIKGLGYKDAVVKHESGKIQVIVQADNLTNDQAVKILNAVHSQLALPSNNITVTYHK
jgi:stage III sporulation protein AH